MTRDLTDKQYRAALKRNGFRGGRIWVTDATGACPDLGIGLVISKDGRVRRRETLAHTIKLRERTATQS